MSLKLMREAAGLTQQDVAVSLGITQGAVWHWENKLTSPHPSKIPKIAELYGVTADDILRGISQDANITMLIDGK